MTLKEQYQYYLEEYKRTGNLPNPSGLLALLLFQDIDKYKEYICSDDEFYDYHNIKEKVKKVINDFSITKKEIRLYNKSVILIEDLPNDDYYNEVGYGVFSSGWCSLIKAIMRDDNLSPEELFNQYAKIYKWFDFSYNLKVMNVKDLYEQYKQEFNITANHPHPSELLFLLLLQEKEKYHPKPGSINSFYNLYKEEINEKIEQVIIDFAISKEEMIKYIEGYSDYFYIEALYEQDKIKYIFEPAIKLLNWANIHYKDRSPEKIYNSIPAAYWGKNNISIIQPNVKQTMSKTKHKTKRRIPSTTTGFKF